MKITVNDIPRELENAVSVKEWLESENFPLTRTVVTINSEALMPDEFNSTILNDGDTLEIFSFVGGG